MTKEKLNEICKNHKKWLGYEPDGVRADFRRATLIAEDLCGVDLRWATLSGADLIGARLRGAILNKADLSGADLSGAKLGGADLSGAILKGADLRGADLRGAKLGRADFSGADLSGADLSSANIEDVILNKICPIICPEYGSFIAWKKAHGKIIKLEICEDSLRSSAFSRKCRCSKAKVLSIENIDGTIAKESRIRSDFDSAFIYTVGEIVEVDDFDTDRTNECSTGIHFFITRDEAVNYY